MNRLMAATLAALMLTKGPLMAETVTFDRDAWVALAGKPDESGPRAEMLDAAIAELPVGTTQDDVLARLGEPDRRFDDAWGYFVSPTLFGGEYRALLVVFDSAGKVSEAKEVGSKTWR